MTEFSPEMKSKIEGFKVAEKQRQAELRAEEERQAQYHKRVEKLMEDRVGVLSMGQSVASRLLEVEVDHDVDLYKIDAEDPKKSALEPAWCVKRPKGHERSAIVLDEDGQFYLCTLDYRNNASGRNNAYGGLVEPHRIIPQVLERDILTFMSDHSLI